MTLHGDHDEDTAPDVKAVLATPAGPVLVKPATLGRTASAGSGAAGSAAAGAVHAAGSALGVLRDRAAPAVGSAVSSALGGAWEVARGTAAPAVGSAVGTAWETVRERGLPLAGEALSSLRDSSGSVAGEAWERARQSGPAQGLAARSDLVAGVVGRGRRRRWPLLAGLAAGLGAGVVVARRRAAAKADVAAAPSPASSGNVGGVNPAVATTGGVPATGAPVAPGRPPTTTAVGGSDAERPLGQPVSGGGDSVGGKVTELPAATNATPDGELHTES